MNRRQMGAFYEQVAAEYLEERGCRVVERNYRCRCGEIDLIVRQGDMLVFVEVKFRRDRSMGDPQEAVNGAKQRRIRGAAMNYLAVRHLPPGVPSRFDVVSILGDQITWIPNAFGGF